MERYIDINIDMDIDKDVDIGYRYRCRCRYKYKYRYRWMERGREEEICPWEMLILIFLPFTSRLKDMPSTRSFKF